MLHKKTIFLLISKIILIIVLIPSESFPIGFSDFPPNIQKHILNNNPYVRSSVDSNKNEQSLNFLAVGLHHQDCRMAMKVIGNYENYSKHIEFIRSSKYIKGRINLVLSSSFMPFDMTLNFKLPRINDVGVYPFVFDNGFLLNLKGEVHVKLFTNQKKYKCLVGMRAAWKGKKTKIPDYLFEMFTKTIGQIGLSKLFRISGHRY